MTGLLERVAGLGRLRTSAVVALASLSLAAASRTDQSGPELVSWLGSWALVAFAAAYLALLVGAVLAPRERSGPTGGEDAGERPVRATGTDSGSFRWVSSAQRGAPHGRGGAPRRSRVPEYL